MRGLDRALLCWFVLLAVIAPAARGQQRVEGRWRGGEDSALEAAGWIPVDADLVLVVDNATALRGTPLGTAVGGVFGADAPLAESRRAWQALAAELGWKEEEAFDKLLGRRVVLVARGIDNAETSRWVLLSEVSVETDRRLKERLKASPRGIAQGQQVLSIEQGRYELTSFRSGGKGKGADSGRSVTMMLAPTGKAEVLDGLLGQLAGGAPAARILREETAFGEAVRLGTPEVLLIARLGAREGAAAGGGDAWPDFLILSASRGAAEAPGLWVARVALRERARQKELLAAGISSDGVFNALSPSSLLTIMQVAPLATIVGRTLPFDDPLAQLPWPPRAAELFTGKQLIRVHSAPGAGPEAKEGLVCTLAMETTDGEKLAAVLDPSIATFFAELERAAGQRSESTPAFPDFAGFAPEASRLLRVEMGAAGAAVGAGSGMTAAWAFPSIGAGKAAWWALAMSASGEGEQRAAGAVRAVAGAVLQGAEGKQGPAKERRWIWLMSARPRELEANLPPGVPDLGGLRGLMRRAEEAGCRLFISGDGDIHGEVRIRLIEGGVR